MHRLLRRQLKKLSLEPDNVLDIAPLLVQIESAYKDYDNDIAHLETIIEKSSLELFETNKKLQQNVTTLTNQLNRIVSNINEIIFETDIDGNWTYLNPAWEEFTGLTVEESLGKHYSGFFGKESNESIFGDVVFKELEDKTIKRVVKYVNHNGEEHWASVVLKVVSNNGWYEGTIGSIVNITKLKAVENDLILARDKESKANKAKAEFLSTMSHEIRTPLNAVIGISHILLLEDHKEEQIENLNALKFSSEHLLGLINDILDFNKIESGVLELELREFSLENILQGLQKVFQQKAKEKRINFRIKKDSELPDILKGDSMRLFQILTNLVNNAVKFTEEGKVTLDIEVSSQTDDKVVILFQIIDTGIGIPVNKLDKIFESFTQANSNTTREYGGTGLGLAICKKLLEIMDSKLQVKSTEGEGSVFSFEVEFEKSEKSSDLLPNYGNRLQPFSSLKGLNVLVVEDYKMNILVIERFLKKWDVYHDIALDGAIAIEMAVKKEYDLILMDLQMPVMNGYDSSREIRQNTTVHNRTIPIFALSASVSMNVKNKITEFGMDGHISKPFNPSELYELLSSIRNKTQIG